MATRNRIGDLSPDEIDLEVMRAFHVGKDMFAVSVELSDKHSAFGRAYLLLVHFDGRQIQFEIVLQLENQMLGHVSTSPTDHVLMEVGGVTHFLRGAAETTARTPDPFFYRMFLPPGGPLFTYGEDGWVCRFDGRAWQPIKPIVKSFLRAMHGPSADLIHVVGSHGTLLHLRGDRWHQVPLDFNRSIEAVQVSADGTISLGCEDGYCFQYREGHLWEIAAPDSDFMSICEFKGARYWGENDFGLFVQKGDKLKKFRALEFVFAMEASEDLLVATGWKEVFAYNGSEWSGFEFGYDGNLFAHFIDMTARYL